MAVNKNGIVVLGAVFVDIKGFPEDIYVPYGRNAGHVEYIHGGVSRNVVEDIANLELRPTFLGIADNTALGEDVVRKLQRHKVNTEYMKEIPNGMGTWLAVFDHNGDLAGSISQRPNLMPILDILEENGDEIIENCDSIVAEIDMDKEIIKKLVQLCEKYDKKFVPYSPGGSVATAAFMICASLEFERIVFVGQDLAYQGDITHAGGEVSHVLNEDKGIKMIDGIDGKPIRSRHDWIIYRDWFEESIEDMKDKIEVIDATEGGALIHGTKLMSLQEVIEDYCHREVDVVDILNKQDPVFNQEEYARVQQEIQGYVGELKEIREKAQSAEKVCDKALKLLKKEPENRKITKLQQKVLCATEEIADYTIYDLVDIYMSKIANKYLSGVFVVSDDSHKDEVNMYLSSKMIFQDLAGSADKLLPLFEEAAAEV